MNFLYTILLVFPLIFGFDNLKKAHLADKYSEQYDILEKELAKDYTKPHLEEAFNEQINICLQNGDSVSATMFKRQLMRLLFANEQLQKGDSLTIALLNFYKRHKLDDLFTYTAGESSIELNRMGQPDKTIPRLREAYSKIIQNKTNNFKAEICTELSFGFFSKAQYDSSIFYANIGYNTAKEVKDTATMISASNTVAVCYKRLLAMNKSIQQYKLTYKLLQESSGSADQAKTILNNIASLYSDMGHFNDAVNISREIFLYYKNNQKPNNQESISKIAYLNTHASILNNIGMHKNALDTLQTALSYYAEGTPPALKMAVYYNIANSYSHLGDSKSDSTLHYINLAHKYRPFSNHTVNIANLYYLHGNFIKEQKKYSQAREYFLQAREYTKNISGGIRANTLKQLIEIEAVTNNYKQAYEYGQELVDVLQQNFNEEYNKEAAGYKIELDVSAKELQIANLKTEQLRISLISERHKITAIAAFIICLLMIIAIILILKIKKNKQIIKEKEMRSQFSKKLDSLAEKNTQSYIDGLEEEKERLSKLLHDGICNSLLSLGMQLKGKITDGEVQKIDFLREEVRALSHQLSLPSFSGLNFSQVMTQFISEIENLECFKTHCHIDNHLSNTILTNQEQTELYRILQECTANIIKHAKAQDVYYTFTAENEYLSLTIEDNGVGFYPDRVKYGLGINLIKKRIQSLHGEFSLDSTPGKGTLIIVKLKLNYAHEQ